MNLALIPLLLLLTSCSVIVSPIAGSFSKHPEDMKNKLSKEGKKFLDDIFKGIDLDQLQDFHVHTVGLGKGKTGAWVNPKMQSLFHPYKYLQYSVYLSASGIDNIDRADGQYFERLMELRKAEPRYGKLRLLAFDHHYDESGQKIEEKSSFYIPNQYVWKLYSKYPDTIIPSISIHPDRTDALEELEKWGKRGVKMIKWLPNAQRIDASLEKHDEFYKIVKKYNMSILTHTGLEKAVDGEEFQELGNPLRFRRPLDMGVKIIMAHAASLGECKDLDKSHEMKSCFDLFWRLLKEKKYEKNLFGEISGITIHTRIGRPLNIILEHPEIHHRLVNGSDYPLPAINILYRTGQMRKMNYITENEEKLLNEIYFYNPLLFDFALKRALKHPKTGQKLLPAVFEVPKSLL